MQVKWKIRKGAAEDRDGIIRCRQAAFESEDVEKQDVSYWQWEFIENHAGPAEIFVACDENKIVGHYAVIPQRFIIDQKPLFGSIVVDVMTHPGYRYQNMFTSLGRFAIEYCSNETLLEFTTGYPIRPEVLPGHLKVGWRARFNIPLFILPLSLYNIIRNKIKFFQDRPFIASMVDLIPSFVFRTVSSFLLFHQKKYRVIVADHMEEDEYQTFWGKFVKQIPTDCVIQERTLKYLQWRYESNPRRRYKYILAYDDARRLVGVIVTREVLFQKIEIMVIVDAWVLKNDSSSIYRHLLKEIKNISLKNRYPMCAMMLTKNNPVFESPLRFGFIPTPYRFTLITREFKENSIIQSDQLKWHLMWGDTDDV